MSQGRSARPVAAATRQGARRDAAAPVELPRMRPLRVPRSLAEEAADALREQILAGGFQRGQHLVEARIARGLNVSRGPIREALKLLRAEGLVQEEPRRGSFVVTLDETDVREIYDLRAAVEGRAGRLLAARGSEQSFGELRRLLEQLETAAAAGDTRAVSRHDLAFHEGICRLSGNRRLHSVFVRHVPVLRTFLQLDEHLYGSPEEIPRQHRPLLEAIEARDPGLAAARLEAHCEEARDLVVGYLAARARGDT